jgi:hypothetical protein
MARTITKKAFDDDLMLSDDFDESVLDKIEKRLHKDGKQGGDVSSTMFDSDTSGPSQSFSLDDFETDSPSEANPNGKPPSDGESRRDASGSSSAASKKAARRIARSKLIMMAAVGVVLLSAVAFAVAKLAHTPKPVIPIVTMIKRSVPVPVRTEKHEFLIRAGPSQEKALFNMGIEINFYGMDGPGRPEEEEVALRDAIYRFLSDEQPAKNTQRLWENVVANDLQPYLKTTFPNKGLKSVKLTRFARL